MPDSTEYGWVFTNSDTKDNLYTSDRDYYSNKTWEGLYNQAAINAQATTDVAKVNYQDSLLEAYTSAMQNKSALEQTSLFGEAKEAQLANIDAAMESAFATYQNNLYAQEQAINQKYQQNLTAIDEALTKQAENYNAFAGSTYEYLQFLFDEYEAAADDVNNIFINNDLWSRYTVTEIDEEGNATRRLKTWQELASPGAKNEEGEYTGLFDERGNLTVKGSEFFDLMLNEISSTGISSDENAKYKYGKGYWEWLNETNPELKEWATSANQYDYTIAGTNVGSFKQDVGLLSTDETYRFMERFGGLTAEEAKSMYADFEAELKTLTEAASGEKGKNNAREITQSVATLSDKLKEYCDDLGIPLTDDDWSLIKRELQEQIGSTKTMGEMAGKWFGTVGYTAFDAIAIGSTTGAAIGGPVGVAVGGIAGAIIGLIGGVVWASINTDTQRKANQAAALNATERLNQTLVYLTKYATEQQSKLSFEAKTQHGVK